MIPNKMVPWKYSTRNKQVPAERLAIAGLAVAYNMEQYPTNGPFPTQINRAEEDVIVLEFDQEIS